MENNWYKVRIPCEHSDKRKNGYNSVYVFAEGLQDVLTRLNKLLGTESNSNKRGFPDICTLSREESKILERSIENNGESLEAVKVRWYFEKRE